ncbi:uncharacterized protein LTR77_000829 [Saxophila tyrrhenica]|uniref:Large ribosomal subunit protein bL28m n=1 Tax=Saxophila tyrrhenica TaxID=1690608 RepID=A0AAV9PSF7_9PEZI|nr:hypothetical protein LTR77_000829 [Saxophila tyrrhenica]
MSVLIQRPLALRPAACRGFSTTVQRCTSLQIEKNDPEALADIVPPYPYGPAQWYKQSNRGLYGGQRIQFGNNVGPKFETKTRRTWHPNVFRKRLYSRALDRYVQIKVTTRVMRTIDKLGGLDEYLLGEKEARIKELGVSGWWLRWAIMQTRDVRERFLQERQLLGLPKEGIEAMIEEPEATVEGEAQVAAKGQDSIGERVDVAASQQKRLKFRVGPRSHLYYTPTGWQRARPNEELAFKRHVRLRSHQYKTFYQDQTVLAFATFDEITKGQVLSQQEKASLRQKLQNEVLKKAEKIVESLWQARCLKFAAKQRRRMNRLRAKSKAKARGGTRAELRAMRRSQRKQGEAEGLVKEAIGA